MACSSSTAPINISSTGYTDDCYLKCEYKYNYPRSPATTISNNGNYLALSYDKVKIVYNNNDLRAQNIRIYSPSIHTFNGIKADAEMIIKHVGMGQSLLVCIPIQISSSTNNASKTLDFLITQAASRVPAAGESAVVSSNNFTLSDFIPKKKPFFSYGGTLPYPPCNGDHQYVVFMPEDSQVFISSKTMALLKKIIIPSDIKIKSPHQYFYNKIGAIYSNPESDEGDDDIYIDCQPTGSDGELIPVPGTSNDPDKKPPLDFNNPIVLILISVIAGFVVIFLLSVIFKFFKRRRGASSGSTVTPSSDLGGD